MNTATEQEEEKTEPTPGAVAKKAAESASQIRSQIHPDYGRHVDCMHLDGGVVYYRDIMNDEWITDAVVLPSTLIPRALRAFHEGAYGCHLGLHKSTTAMMERVWFPHMATAMKRHIKDCGPCARAKAISRQGAGHLQSQLYNEVFENVAIDLQGPYVKSSKGNLYHLHMVCKYSNWNVSVAIPDKKMETVADAVYRHWFMSGPSKAPRTITSDRGTEFCNGLFQALMELHGVRHLKTTPYHPTGNAQCERGHRTYNQILRILVHKYGVDWDEALMYACYAMNTHAIEGSTVSPYELAFGVKPTNANVMAALNNPQWKSKADMSHEEHVRLLKSRLSEVQSQVQLARLQMQRKNNAMARRRRYERKYKEGDLVLLWRPDVQRGVFGKLAFKAVGPFEVVSRHDKNDNVYRLRKCGEPNSRVTSHNVRDICPYITKEAHESEQASGDDGGLQSAPPFSVSKGDFLLLPYGKQDFICRVVHWDETSQVAKVHLYNNKANDGKLEKVQPVWYNPDNENDEIYCSVARRDQDHGAYLAWQVDLHIDEFYQIEIKGKLHQQKGTAKFSKVTLPRHLKAGVRKHRPLK